jgi:hypothetical protein
VAMSDDHKIYVDAAQPATLNDGAGKLTDYPTMQGAVMAWHFENRASEIQLKTMTFSSKDPLDMVFFSAHHWS